MQFTLSDQWTRRPESAVDKRSWRPEFLQIKEAGVGDFECAEVKCPLEKMTEISKGFMGRLQPSGMLEPDGHIAKAWGDEWSEWQKQIITLYFNHLRDCEFKPAGLNCGHDDRGNPYSGYKRPIGKGIASYPPERFTLNGGDSYGIVIEYIYIDKRASSILFVLIWTAVVGALGSVICILLWFRTRTVGKC